MKLTSKIDIEAPADQVFATLVDHGAWESEARQRGVEVERPADMPLAGVGAGWRLRFRFRGRDRKVVLRIDEMTPPALQVMSFQGQAFEGVVRLEVTALSARRARLKAAIDLRARTLAARLFLNTLRLAKGRVVARLDRRLAELGARIEARHARARA